MMTKRVVMCSESITVDVVLPSLKDFSWFGPAIERFVCEVVDGCSPSKDKCFYPDVRSDGIHMTVKFGGRWDKRSDARPSFVDRAVEFMMALHKSKVKFAVDTFEKEEAARLDAVWYEIDVSNPGASIEVISFEQAYE